MLSVYIFLVVLFLVVAFFALLIIERRREVRFFAERRDTFDAWVTHVEGELRTLKTAEIIEQTGKYVVFHVTHVAVALLHFLARKVEQVLRKLRRRVQRARPKQEEPSQYVKEMREFKNGLNGEE